LQSSPLITAADITNARLVRTRAVLPSKYILGQWHSVSHRTNCCGLNTRLERTRSCRAPVVDRAAVDMLKVAWMELTAECIENCFRKAGFMGPGTEDVIDHPPEGRSHEGLWQRVVDTQMAGPDVACDDFVSADDDADIAEPCTDEAIVREVRALPDCPETDEDDDEDAALPPVAVNASTAIGYIASLKELKELCSRGPGDEHITALEKLETAVIRSALKKQTCITDFFQK
ncbi:tigger transposable element-derived protein 6-like, partial [Dermacentor andersoni]|uniref:tigger transposable element-derived protein 6-like n=1 Tax=Dermacentor andersoni TaxID=34620 RepID=UPI003B3AFF97